MGGALGPGHDVPERCRGEHVSGVVVKVYEHHLIQAANGDVRAGEQERKRGRGLVPVLEVEIGNNYVGVREFGGKE